MIGRAMVLLALSGFMAGCTDGPDNTGTDTDVGNRDQRIDGAADLETDDEFVDSHDVQMCMDGDGNIYVTWIDDRGGTYDDVYFNRSRDFGETWLDEPIRVKAGNGNASGLDMECAGERIFLAWEDDRDGETNYENIYLNYSTDGGDTWEDSDILIDDDPDGLAVSLGPKIALYQGRVHVAWYDQRKGAPDIYMATSSNGGRRFGEPVQISGDREQANAEDWAGNPDVVVDKETGAVHVVWEDARNGKLDLFYSSSLSAGQSFGPQKRIDKGDEGGESYAFSPKVQADNGYVYIVWHDRRFSAINNSDVLFNYSSDNGDTFFDEALRVEGDDPGLSDSLEPDIITEGNTAHVVWQDARNQGYDIYYQQIVDGELVTRIDEEDGEVQDEIRMDVGDDIGLTNAIKPRIVTDGERMVVSWEDRREDQSAGYNDLYYNFFDPQAIEDDEDSIGWLEDDDLRLDSVLAGTSYAIEHQTEIYGDELFTVWIDGRNGSNDIYFSRVALGEEVDYFTYENADTDAQ